MPDKIDGLRGIAIAGPTASGKSHLALNWARRHGAIVINADAMQVYSNLRVLTARPTVGEEMLASHRLYGGIDGQIATSAQAWAFDAAQEIANARAQSAIPVLVGGSGLYFKALFSGLASLPPIPPIIRHRWRQRAKMEGSKALFQELQSRDSIMAARLQPSDTQRLTRALEVIDATGRSLSDFQNEASVPLEAPDGWHKIWINPERGDLSARIAARVETMLAQGAIDEVDALLALSLDPALPVMKAIGVRELANLIRGTSDLATARERMTMATRRYAKRQMTWFRTQMVDWRAVDMS